MIEVKVDGLVVDEVSDAYAVAYAGDWPVHGGGESDGRE